MKTVPTVFEFSIVMLVAASSFIMLMIFMKWISKRFFNDDEKKTQEIFWMKFKKEYNLLLIQLNLVY